jgi:hypothetical protein
MRTKAVLTIGSALTVLLSPSVANAEPPRAHTVKYIVHSDVPAAADIYYRDAEPPNWADYSHNPYVFSPKVEANIAPGAPWVLETALADPNRWAMVVVSVASPADTPGFRCELIVDGVTATVDDGPKGALCSLRHW